MPSLKRDSRNVSGPFSYHGTQTERIVEVYFDWGYWRVIYAGTGLFIGTDKAQAVEIGGIWAKRFDAALKVEDLPRPFNGPLEDE